MVTSLAQILERKRQEELLSKENMISGVGQGQLQGAETAKVIAAREAEASKSRFNPLNTLASAGLGFVTGGPVGAVMGAVSAPKGNFKPLDIIKKGAVNALTANALPEVPQALGPGGEDITSTIGRTVQEFAKPENLSKVIPALESAGLDKETIAPLKEISKAYDLKIKEEKKLTDEVAKEDRKQKNAIELIKTKAENKPVKTTTTTKKGNSDIYNEYASEVETIDPFVLEKQKGIPFAKITDEAIKLYRADESLSDAQKNTLVNKIMAKKNKYLQQKKNQAKKDEKARKDKALLGE